MPRRKSIVTVIEERSASSPQGTREVAPRWSRSSAEGRCREDGAQEEGRGDTRSPEDEDRSSSSQASAWSWASSGLEDQGGVDDDGTRSLDAVGDPHPEGASPWVEAALRPRGHLRDGLRGAALKEKLARQGRGGRRAH